MATMDLPSPGSAGMGPSRPFLGLSEDSRRTEPAISPTASWTLTPWVAEGPLNPSTVTPAPPPPPTLASLTLDPANVFGGQSSTGTVTLTGPAPASGAQVFLSSSDGAARVPSSVTIPAGTTSATFTVNTSFVLISTSATISATYNGTTRTATLSVLL